MCFSSKQAPQCSPTPTQMAGTHVRTFVSMFMVYSLHTGAESEYIRVKRFSCKHLCISGRLCLCILKNTTAAAAWLVALLSDLSCNLQTLTFFFPSSTDSSTANLRLLTTDLLFLVTLLGPLRCGLWPPGAQSYVRACSTRLHVPEQQVLSSSKV